MPGRAFDQVEPERSAPGTERNQDGRASCLACGTRIGTDEPTIKIHGALVHLRCAVYRRRRAGRQAA
jgi:hypothetical protein